MLQDKILVMKIGFHGHEKLEKIIQRKLEEERVCGTTYWGYGGVLCHPTRSVQPFAKEVAKTGQTVSVLFAATPSPFFGDPAAATEYSPDGLVWDEVPDGIRITASKYALVLKALQECEEVLPLDQYIVANGPSMGRKLSGYMRFRVDKAVAQLDPFSEAEWQPSLKIAFKAELVAPYCVFVR